MEGEAITSADQLSKCSVRIERTASGKVARKLSTDDRASKELIEATVDLHLAEFYRMDRAIEAHENPLR